MKHDIDKEKIGLVPYKKEWNDEFIRELRNLSAVFEQHVCRIEQIGSTAALDLSAKPIIDIAVRLKDVKLVRELIQPLAELSYCYMGEFIAPRWHYFYKGRPREFNLHIVDGSTDHWERWIRFRDILRSDERIKREYQKLKSSLAKKYHSQRKKIY